MKYASDDCFRTWCDFVAGLPVKWQVLKPHPYAKDTDTDKWVWIKMSVNYKGKSYFFRHEKQMYELMEKVLEDVVHDYTVLLEGVRMINRGDDNGKG